jgi:cell fate regulator YaaT (PSP1 superfamily)
LVELVEVQFKGNRRECFTWDNQHPLVPGDSVIVELERGRDLGCITAVGEKVAEKCSAGCGGDPKSFDARGARKILRVASDEDRHLHEELRKEEQEVKQAVVERVKHRGLVMKVCDAEWQWDRKKLTVYFTAEARVDFRALVRDLASLFRTRIELRQIGARDEAKRLDGAGRCGRRFCCASWLCNLKPISLALAKDQRLSLNPSQISGGCSRLLCCLRYEHDFYAASRKRFPKEGRPIRTANGSEMVVSVDILRERLLLRAEDGSTRIAMLQELKDEVGSLDHKKPRQPDKPPSALVSFDEGNEQITTEEAVEAVTPGKRRRRWRRGRRRKRNNQGDEPQSSGDESKPGPESGRDG